MRNEQEILAQIEKLEELKNDFMYNEEKQEIRGIIHALKWVLS